MPLINLDPAGLFKKGGGGGGRSQTPLSDKYGAENVQRISQMFPVNLQSYNAAGGAGGLGGRSFEQWLEDHMAAHPQDEVAQMYQKVASGQSLDNLESGMLPASGDGAPTQEEIDSGAVEPIYEDVPLEKGLLDASLPSITDDINTDDGRRQIVDELSKGIVDSTRNATGILNRTQGGHFDSNQ